MPSASVMRSAHPLGSLRPRTVLLLENGSCCCRYDGPYRAVRRASSSSSAFCFSLHDGQLLPFHTRTTHLSAVHLEPTACIEVERERNHHNHHANDISRTGGQRTAAVSAASGTAPAGAIGGASTA